MAVKIFGSMRSRASRCVWAAEELGVDYELVAVRDTRAPRLSGDQSQRPRSHNAGRRPDALKSLAINLYLARTSGGALAPASLAEDGLMTMWSFWAMTELERHALDFIHAHRRLRAGQARSGRCRTRRSKLSKSR